MNPLIPSMVLAFATIGLAPALAHADSTAPTDDASHASAPQSVIADTTITESGPPAQQRGFQMDVRGGYVHPFGKFARDARYGTARSAFVEVAAGGRVHPRIYLGGFARIADVIQFGGEAIYYMRPAARVNPWVGAGVGAEATSISNSPFSGSSTFVGPFGRITAGVDARINHYFGIGGFIGGGLGQFTSVTIRSNDTTTDHSIRRKSFHGDLSIGVRFILFP